MVEILKQTDQPLFPNVLWDKPVNKTVAKKLLIIGGNQQRFQKVQQAYQYAKAAGIGEAKVLLPDSLESALGELPDALFAPSTPAGSMDKSAMEIIQKLGKEVDGLLLIGDLTKHPSTIGLLEDLLRDIEQPIAISSEVIESLLFKPEQLGGKRLLIAPTQTYVKLASQLGVGVAIQPNANLLNKAELLSSLAEKLPADYVLANEDLMVHASGRTSLTSLKVVDEVSIASYMATLWLQHKSSFKSLTTAAYELAKN